MESSGTTHMNRPMAATDVSHRDIEPGSLHAIEARYGIEARELPVWLWVFMTICLGATGGLTPFFIHTAEKLVSNAGLFTAAILLMGAVVLLSFSAPAIERALYTRNVKWMGRCWRLSGTSTPLGVYRLGRRQVVLRFLAAAMFCVLWSMPYIAMCQMGVLEWWTPPVGVLAVWILNAASWLLAPTHILVSEGTLWIYYCWGGKIQVPMDSDAIVIDRRMFGIEEYRINRGRISVTLCGRVWDMSSNCGQADGSRSLNEVLSEEAGKRQ